MPTTSQLQELDKLNRSIKQKSLDYKVNKEYGQESLKEFYKPIIDIKTKEQEVIKEQHKEELNKIQNMTEELKKQQLIVPLIKSLKDHPGVVAVIKGESDGSDLTGKEQYILKQLQDIDDRTLRTLIDYFNKAEPDTESLPSTSVDPPEYTKIPQNLKSDKLGQWLIENALPTVQSAKLLLKEGREDRSVEEIKGGIANYVTFLVENGHTPHFNEKPWTSIKSADRNFYEELGNITGKKLKTKIRSSAKTGTGIPIDNDLQSLIDHSKSDDLQSMVKKLEILYAEKLAGNNNVLDEASEILDTLRRNKIIDISMLKDISNRFTKINE